MNIDKIVKEIDNGNLVIGVSNKFSGKIDIDSEIGVGTKFGIDLVFSEVAPPVGQFSAGLFALDTFILYKLFDTHYSIKEIWTIPPSYLSTIHGTSKYKKSDSTNLAKYYIGEVLKDKLDVVFLDNISSFGRRKAKLNNDKAESFLFLLRDFCKYDTFGFRNSIISEMGGFSQENERLLISR